MCPPIDVVGAMTDLGFDLAVIEEVKSALDIGEKQIAAAAKITPVGGTSFGDLPEGLDLADHTQRARDKVVAALEDMVVGLAGYRTAIVHLVEDSMTVEQDTAASLTKLQQASECLDVPTFASPRQCSAPTPGQEG